MRSHIFKKTVILLCALVFCLVSVLALAADEQWYVLKDKNQKCSVKQLKKKTATVIAGPYATKDEAQKAKADKCPKESKKPKTN